MQGGASVTWATGWGGRQGVPKLNQEGRGVVVQRWQCRGRISIWRDDRITHALVLGESDMVS